MTIGLTTKQGGSAREFSKSFLLMVTGLILFLFPRNIFPQETGFKYLKNYTAREHEWHQQNWSILQDKRGCIYVGNNGALLEFDGVSWRRFIIPNYTVRSLAMDYETGTVYIGGKNEIGFMAPDPDGKGILQYQSLLRQVEKDKLNFALVIRMHTIKEGIYFRTGTYLFRWHSGQLKVIAETDTNHRFKGSFDCHGKLFVRRDNLGLMKLVDEKLILVPGGEKFASRSIFMVAPYLDNKILVGTRLHGFFLYGETHGIEPFKSEADDYLRENQLSYGIRLRSGNYALATNRGGLVIIDAQGKIKRLYTKAAGLLDNLIRYVYEDSQCNLWLAQDKGITKIEGSSPISRCDDRCGLAGIVLAVTAHGPSNILYAGTIDGLFYLDHSGKFLPVPGIPQQCSSLLSTGDTLLAATAGGVFSLEKEDLHQITRLKSLVLYPSSSDPKRTWVGTDIGLVSLYMTANASPRWELEHTIKIADLEVHSIVEDKKGNLWLGTLTKGVLKVDFSRGSDFNNPVITRYDVPGELNLQEIHVFFAAGHIMFATVRGIFRLDNKTDKLIPDPTLGKTFNDGSNGVFRILEDKGRHLWIHSEKRNIEAIPQADGTFSLNTTPFLRIPRAQVNGIYHDPSGRYVWFASSDGLIRFDKTVKKDYNRDFHTLIRRVEVNGKPVFNGYKSKFAHIAKSAGARFAYKDRNIRFQFAAPFFEGETMTRYRTFLEGYDAQWSEPAPETRKDYTNLDSGSYTFRVRAENVYRAPGREALFHFKILPPWYKTWWAFVIYALMFFLAMLLTVRWRSGKLEREKQRLEQIVKERTGEIADKNQQLEAQTFQLKEQSEKLTEMDKVKTRFFTNISHEFRTPLTLIMGPLEEMLAGENNSQSKEQQKKKWGLMLRSSRRLLNLINQLLELSKIESGKMILEASLQNLIPFLKGIVASFEPVTAKKELTLSFLYEAEEIILYFDAGKMEDVIFNLLANSTKFTPPGGKITVGIKRNPPGAAEFPSGSVTLSVRDTGPGIPRGQMEQIFDRFYQSERTHEHHGKGSGIGLTIAKELVELHNGRIDAHSLEGKGTEFIIRLPLPAEAPQVGQTGSDINDSGISGQTIAKKIMMIDNLEAADPGETSEEPQDTASTDKNIILVVEDNADARAYIKGSLEPLYNVVEAKDGKEGIQKALELIPDLIVSDIMMPGTDGYELSRVLKQHVNTSHIPIVLLTAKAGEEDVLEGLQTGADDYITKPFNTKILNARIKNLIDLRSHLQQVLDRDMTLQPAKIPVSHIDKEFIRRLKEVIKKNVSDPDFNVEQLCTKMDMSQPTLYRKIHALSGESPTDFIRSYRLKRGQRLLEEKFGSVIEVALEVGFSSAAYFTKCFKKKFNRLPSQDLEESKS
jgi:signal transduction histidine kinase/DNA-binding NarL/FixJ family response regulator